ncbi:MAG: hypothetical protein DME22_06190 [Verrucomicrobia bacterium]|nr:MAG: hypothetical protein DME22_06190 [Verrucomicrobiota bacterium]PYJ96834.1 MAG: hypothetical protein DME23_18655 [Verrucomicrobiota bacterium]
MSSFPHGASSSDLIRADMAVHEPWLRHPSETSNIQHRTPNIELFGALGVGCSMFFWGSWKANTSKNWT